MSATTTWPAGRSAATLPRRLTHVAVLATDHLVRAGIRAELRDKPGIELLDDPTEAKGEAKGEADVVVAVADPALRDLPTSATRRLVLIADQPRQADLWAAVERGLAVLVPRGEATTTRLLRAIADARHGRGDIPPEQLGHLLRGLSRLNQDVLAPRNLTLAGFSRRESDVLRLLAEGLDVAEIAQKLSYSERTVKNTLHALLARRGLNNRTQAVAQAIRLGLI